MSYKRRISFLILILALATISCQAATQLPGLVKASSTPLPTRADTPTPLPAIAVQPGEENPQEPVYITGDIPYTSPFFLNTISEPFVLLEDEAGFVQRNRDFVFRLNEQVIGPVVMDDNGKLTYSLSLPSVPQGTMLDLDNNGKQDAGVQVFAIAYWSNTWGDPFLEKRDGTGWSTAYASTITDPEKDDEITGGILMIWAPDDQQEISSGFGPDGLLFTKDDPVQPVPAGYNLLDLNQQPFRLYKTPEPDITLNEGAVAVNDYSNMSYEQAFQAMFNKVSEEYPFTKEKNIDWQALYDKYAPLVARSNNQTDFYRVLRDFTYEIPDAHVGVSLDPQVFYQEEGGGFGLVLARLSDGQVIVKNVLPNSPTEKAGIQVGAKILEWNGMPVEQAIAQVKPYFGPFSSEQAKLEQQVAFLTRVPPGTSVKVVYSNPNSSQQSEATMQSEAEYDSLFQSIPSLNSNPLDLPVDARILPSSGLVYIRIPTFSADYNLMAQLWDHAIKASIDNKIPGVILDVRQNSGGSGGMALDFAGYFFDKKIDLYRSYYYNRETKQFEFNDDEAKIEPAPLQYQGQVAVLVSPDCVSACEGFAYAMQQEGRSIIVGNAATAGAFGEVGRGQYKMPGDITMQFPTGRPETPQGQLLIEGKGVQPDITVPVTAESVLGQQDTVLQAAEQALQQKIGNQ